MAQVKNKRILTLIAKRWAKSVLMKSECMIAFSESDLTDDEVTYIQEQVLEIAEKITPLDTCSNSSELVQQYFETK